ncbi:MAG: 30S ribosomal protein S8 [Alphaproteobacteria bacterium]|nr:30S ribosomal protein S8 [Alphaproteobacteria bacterium]
MAMSDPLGDMLARIRNGQSARKAVVLCPASKQKIAVLDVMQREGFIRGYKVEEQDNNKRVACIELKYDSGEPVIQEMKRVSKPGRRVYRGAQDIPHCRNGLGVTIISTPHGVLADHEARAQNVGGEVLCQVF